MIVDSYRFLPRSFRPFYEGRGPFPGEEHPVWTPFGKRLAESRIALLTSAGIHLHSDAAFDLAAERERPEWGDPSWRVIPTSFTAQEIGCAHLHINTDNVLADPEIALPVRALQELADEKVIGGVVERHIAVMGYQDRALSGWRHQTAPAIIAHLQAQEADGLVLAPA